MLAFLRVSPYSVLIILGFGEVLEVHMKQLRAHSKLVSLPYLKSRITLAHGLKNSALGQKQPLISCTYDKIHK